MWERFVYLLAAAVLLGIFYCVVMVNRDSWPYLWYMIKHKYFVYTAGRMLNVPLGRLIIHDFSKFKKDEWEPYRFYFYTKNRVGRGFNAIAATDLAFKQAWKLHLQRNDHHWQYWIHPVNRYAPLEMTENAVREMVADWISANRVINGRYAFLQWWEENRHKIHLHTTTRMRVIELLMQAEMYYRLEGYDLGPVRNLEEATSTIGEKESLGI